MQANDTAVLPGTRGAPGAYAAGVPRVTVTLEPFVCAQHGRSPDGVQVPCARVEHGAKASWQALAEVKVGRATVRPEED